MNLLKNNLQIAIDGPVAAGKGTVSKLLAEQLDILYVDTGAMYRAITYFVKTQDIAFEEEDVVCAYIMSKKPQITLSKPKGEEKDGRLVTVLLNGEDISWKIRTEEISRGVAIVTRYKCIRDYMVPQQQRLAQTSPVIMEGRDITTRVLPHADLKIYLDASEEVRAQRRFQEVLVKGELTTPDQVSQDLKERDYRDMHRDIDPLIKAPGVWVLDTTSYSIPQVVNLIFQKLLEKKLIYEG